MAITTNDTKEIRAHVKVAAAKFQADQSEENAIILRRVTLASLKHDIELAQEGADTAAKLIGIYQAKGEWAEMELLAACLSERLAEVRSGSARWLAFYEER